MKVNIGWISIKLIWFEIRIDKLEFNDPFGNEYQWSINII